MSFGSYRNVKKCFLALLNQSSLGISGVCYMQIMLTKNILKYNHNIFFCFSLGKPAHLYNDLIKRLKNLAKNPTISQDALFLLSKLGINDKSLDYFSENFQTILRNPQQEFNVGYVIMILSRGPEESLKTYLNEVFEVCF